MPVLGALILQLIAQGFEVAAQVFGGCRGLQIGCPAELEGVSGGLRLCGRFGAGRVGARLNVHRRFGGGNRQAKVSSG